MKKVLSEEKTTGNDFSKLVARLSSMVGCKVPDEILMSDLWNLFSRKFDSINLSEFQAAFEMNMMNEFQPKYEHYQIFSGEFMISVLNSYSKYRFKIMAELKQLEIDARPKLQRSETEINNSILKKIIQEFETPDIFATIKYEILVEKGLLDLTIEQKKEYYSRSEMEIKERASNPVDKHEAKKMGELLKEIAIDKKHTELIYGAMKLAYRDFLSNPENKSLVENKLNQE